MNIETLFFLVVGGNPIGLFADKESAKQYAQYRYARRKDVSIVISKQTIKWLHKLSTR